MITLSGQLVELVPLTPAHRDALLAAAADGKLWELWYTSVPSTETIDAYLEKAMLEKEAGESIPFVVVFKESEEVIGSTRFCNIDTPNRRLEIGYTWYAGSSQKTGVNTECKYLLLSYAFEKWGAGSVEFRTHFHNHTSRHAILRLGAKQDGILRNHRLDPDGSFRDTVVFSILESEWSTVKKGLEFKMRRSY